MLITRDMIITGVTCCLISACRSEHKLGGSGTPTPQSIVSSTVANPITWNDVANVYERVADYVCVYEKIEKAISKGEEQKIRFSFRKPFDVRMDWLDNQG